MKVRMKIGVSGTRDGRDWPAVGEVLETTEREAVELCALGFADPVAEILAPRKATAKKAEKRA